MEDFKPMNRQTVHNPMTLEQMAELFGIDMKDDKSVVQMMEIVDRVRMIERFHGIV